MDKYEIINCYYDYVGEYYFLQIINETKHKLFHYKLSIQDMYFIFFEIYELGYDYKSEFTKFYDDIIYDFKIKNKNIVCRIVYDYEIVQFEFKIKLFLKYLIELYSKQGYEVK